MAATTRENATRVISLTPPDIHTYVDGEMQINAYFFAPGRAPRTRVNKAKRSAA
jgi:hypothetical protein